MATDSYATFASEMAAAIAMLRGAAIEFSCNGMPRQWRDVSQQANKAQKALDEFCINRGITL